MATRIRLGDFELAGTHNDWTLSRVKIAQTGVSAGQTYLQPIGYFSNLHAALVRLMEQTLRDSDAQTVQELADAIIDLRKELAPLLQLNTAPAPE